MAMDLRDPNVWISHLLENLPEEKLASALKDDNPNWEYIDGEIVKLGSLAHSQLDIPELQRRGLVILASESKDFRLLAHLLRTLQHAGDPHLALRLLALYVEHYWAVAAPQNMAHKKRFASQVIKRFETGIEGFSQNAATEQRDALSGELAKLAQCWQSHNAPELAQATDDLFALYQRAFNRAAPAPVPTPAASGSSPQTTATSESGVTQPSAPAPQIVIDSHDDKAWRDTLLKVAAILCERQPDSPQGYRLRRHALWQNITSTPQAESDGRTPLAAVSADMVADYHAQLGSADMALWQQVEKSVLLAPYWLDGHCLSAQTALRLGYKQVADAIRDEVIRFLERLPQLTGLLFNDHTPFISEQTYLQLLEQRYLPSLFNGLVKAMNAAPPESEEKLAVLRVMRMLEDKSGRNNEVVKQYMAKRWSEKFHGQRDIQAQLMSHLDYALAHTDWHAERQAGDGDAISRWTPYDKPVVSAQKELSKLPVYQRVYQSLKTRALGVLPADLNLRDQVGPTFDQVFTSADDNKLVVPQFLTRYGLQSYFVKQRDELVELTAMDSWVLNLTRSVKYSDADRAEIQRQLTEQYISDYTATWRAGMDNLNIRNFESIGQLTGALEQVISGDQPLQRALTVLRDNTQPGVFSEKLSAKEREEALAEPDYQLLTRLGHEFAPENSTLAVQKDKESTMQAVYQQLTELHRYLLAIQNAPVPGKSALKAVQLRLDQNSSDPIFATRQMAKTLPAPLNRWVGRLTDQAWHVVMVEAVHYMEVDWRDSVVKPFNEQLANNYPFNPRSAQDASLDAFERFFKPDGILDTFYQQNLKLFIDNDLSLEDGDNNVIIREDIIAQLETAQKIRDIFFSKQNGLGTSFAVETVSLSGNKRRSVLNLDGQLVDYSQGRNYTAHLVWPNNMREGNESKLTLIGTSGNAPRSISFSGPWAQFRLFGAGQLTGVQDGNFTVRFSVDGGAMTYRVHTDTEDNPFSGGLFSQFGLSDTLY
ncbi:TPA: type VI secretion system membrane subunit TssM [Escherichia coli]|nr:type VI secretion system membrane subunit TssM [Escherichia coli]